MKSPTRLIAGLLISIVAGAQQNHDMTNCSMHDKRAKSHDTSQQQQSEAHFAAVEHRGEQAMGFDQDKTTHHFILQATGGTIRVEANSTTDDVNRTAIRQHLAHIAKLFSQGDFEIPMFVHDQTPPGVSVMQNRKNAILYQYHELPAGGEVVITSADHKAIDAIHEFLKFQIQDHRTGDSLSVQ